MQEQIKLSSIRKSILNILEIQSAPGANAKKSVISKYADNETFRRLLYYALNPMLTYNVSEATLRDRSFPGFQIKQSLTDIFAVCEKLSARKALDYATVDQVQSFLDTVPEDDTEREFYIQLLSKTLRLGVTAKTVNKVIPGLIPEWEVQQAYPIEKYPFAQGTEFWLTEKLNGVRATYYKGKLYARSGEPYKGLDHITDWLTVAVEDMYVLDGELTLLNRGELSDNEAFRTATGIINSDAEDKSAICFTIFDMIPMRDFEQAPYMSYSDRRALLDYVFSDNSPADAVRRTPVLYHGSDQTKIDELLEQMVREDKEGLMVNLNVPYQRKRHRGILKVKRFYTMDLPIIGLEQGSGRLAGKLGAFVLDYKGNEVRVGSGFTDEQRTEFWEARKLIGTLCEVKYKEISKDKKTGMESLQFPVFVRLRTDKHEVSYG